jgi:signal transduction histidine kinase
VAPPVLCAGGLASAGTDVLASFVGNHGTVSVVRRRWLIVALPLLVYAAGVGLVIASVFSADRTGLDAATFIGISLPAVSLGFLLARRRPDNPIGGALILLAAAPVLTDGIEGWGTTFGTAHAWPGAHVAAIVQPGVWVLNLAGFVLLCLVFPDGLMPGRRRQALPWLFLGTAVVVNTVVSLDPANYEAEGGVLPGTSPVHLDRPLWVAVEVVAGLAFAAVLFGCVASLVVRYQGGDQLTRLQLRWLVLGAGSVPVLLVAGWVAEALSVPISVAYSGFMIAMLVLVPAAVTVAILRHDLLDVDRLLSESVSWVLTTLVAAGIFAIVVLGAAELGDRGSSLGVAGAAFVTALILLPVYRWLHEAVGKVVDRERTVMMACMREYVREVRDGRAQPEEVEGVLRRCLDDASLRVILKIPNSDGYVDLDGEPSGGGQPESSIPLSSGEAEVGVIVLGRSSARRVRRARELAVEARLPIEVSRLRLELRRALDDATSSRARLVEAATVERRRLERDLHDGAQQRILAVGMRLRSIQRLHSRGEPTYWELEHAVGALEATVAELRRLAHGVRPSQLDDGLEAAVRALVSDSPIPVEVSVGDVAVTEVVAATAYFVVAEGLANTLKHSQAKNAKVMIGRRDQVLSVELTDDGLGGARAGFGLTALRDRVAALGGRIDVISPIGRGTTIRAEF